MKTIIKLIMSAFLLILISGCGGLTQDIKVESATSQKVNLDGYKSYAWLAAVNLMVDQNSTYKRRGYSINEYIKSQVNKQLLNNGRIESNSTPDFFISYVVGVNMDAVKEKVDDEGKKSLENIPEAALAIILIDAKTKEIIWLAAAEATPNENHTDAESKERIDFAITKMFSDF